VASFAADSLLRFIADLSSRCRVASLNLYTCIPLLIRALAGQR